MKLSERITDYVNEPGIIRAMLGTSSKDLPRSTAVIGLSEDPAKPSHYVSAYMQNNGYKIYPVNPSVAEVLGERAYASLSELPVRPDIVIVFRLPRFLPAIVEEMIQLGLPNLWIQLGIIDLGAAARAEAAGIHVVMDRCIMVEHRHMTLR